MIINTKSKYYIQDIQLGDEKYIIELALNDDKSVVRLTEVCERSNEESEIEPDYACMHKTYDFEEVL